MGLISEFKKFALKGNVLDLAVGIIIGGAFGTVVKSLVDHVMMPVIGLVTPAKLDLGGLFYSWAEKEPANPAEAAESGQALMYGSFITNIISFIILAFAVFLIVKAFNKAKESLIEEEEAKPAEPSDEVKLLTEIRDALVKKEG